MYYLIYDSFSDKVLSKHKTIKNAGKKGNKFLEVFKRHDVVSYYARMVLVRDDGARLTDYEYNECIRYISFRF